MSSTTENLGLTLPAGSEWADVAVLNENWAKIDRQVLRAMAAAAAYDAGKTYQQGDFCTQGGLLYRANQAIAQPEAWTVGHWTAISITDVIQGLTAADVDAAPIGYGLGGGGANVTSDQDLNNITTNGWYAFSTPPANAPTQETDGWPSGYSYMLVASRDQNTVSQIVFASNQAQVLGCIVKRYCVNSEWSPWEWVNPPMLLGVEYRTTERYQGKPVYAMAFACGAMTNGAEIDYPLKSGNQVETLVRGIAYGSGNSPLPAIYGKSLENTWTAYAAFFQRSMIFYCGTSAEGNNSSTVIYYTKVGD